MNVLVLTLFVSFALVALLLLGFSSSVKRGDIDHADRLSLLPLEDEPTLVDAQDAAAATTVALETSR